MKKLTGVLLSASSIVAVFTGGCSPPPVRIGYLALPSNLPIFVAIEKGYFQEEGIKVETTDYASSEEAMRKLMRDSVDCTMGCDIPQLVVLYQDNPDRFKIFMPGLETQDQFACHVVVMANSPLRSPLQLKGKTIGTAQGTIPVMYVKMFLKNFMDPDRDVAIVQVADQLQAEALSSHQCDALLTMEPWATVLLGSNYARDLVENPRVKYIADPFPATANVFSAKFYARQPGLAAKVNRALVKAVAYIRTNGDDARKLLTKYARLDGVTAQQVHIFVYPEGGDETTARRSVQTLADRMLEAGILTKQLKTDDLFLNADQLK